MLNLRAWIGGFPAAIQYVIVFGIVMIVLYVSLTLTRWIGSRSNSRQRTFDNPEEYADSVPDLFATTQFRKKNSNPEAKEDKED